MHQPDTTPRHSIYYDYRVYPFSRPPEMDGHSLNHQVVIVGAGPIGMMTALNLAQHGIPSVVLEADNQVSHGSRAIVFTRRSMEILQQVGVTARILEKALPWSRGNSFYRGQCVFRMEAPDTPDSRFRPMYNLQQQYLEEYILDQVMHSELIEMRWASKVMAVEQDDNSVHLTVDTPEGEYRLTSDWLVAADGARSFVRSALNQRMEGASYSGQFVIADIRIDLDFPTERRAYFDPEWNPGNTVLMHREPDNIWRIDYQLPQGETPEQALSEASLHQRINAQLKMVGIDAPWELDWCSVYSARTLTLPDYRVGRVVFTGDAAHILPIFGVRGANTGLQDCQNLAWKLALHIKGVAGLDLVDSYSCERVQAAREIIDEAGKSTRFMTPPSKGYRLLRDATLSLSLQKDFVGPLFHWRTSRAHNYPDSSLNTAADNAVFASGPANGMPLENIQLSENNYLFDHLDNAFNLLLFNLTPVQLDQMQTLQANLRAEEIPINLLHVTSRPAEQAEPSVTQLVDISGHMRSAYGAGSGSVYLARPDHHVAARWLSLDVAAVKQAIDNILNKA